MLTWSSFRRLSYFLGVTAFFLFVAGVVFLIYKPAPTCFDGKQNQEEQGVDCGGPCALACPQTVLPLTVYWTRPLFVSSENYDVAVLVENKNLGLGLRRLPYKITLYGEDNETLAVRQGETFVNPREKFLIFENSLAVGSSTVQRAKIDFANNLQWEKSEPIPSVITINRKEFSNDPTPKLHLVVNNNSLNDYSDIKIATVLSDNLENTFAASSSFVDSLLAGQKADIFLTWPKPFITEPSYVDYYWRIDGFKK